MTTTRRSFLTDTAAMGFLAPFLFNPAFASAVETATTDHSGAAPTAGQDYWAGLYKNASARGRGGMKPPNEDRTPSFLHYGAKTGLRWVEDIKSEELPDFDDDAVVTMEIGGFRAGSRDTSKLAKVSFAQLHLSC